VEATAHRVRFRNLHNINNINEFLLEALQHVINNIFADMHDDDRLGLQINHPGLDRPILIPFCRYDQLDAESVLRRIQKVGSL
jgi:hypothetical protein